MSSAKAVSPVKQQIEAGALQKLEQSFRRASRTGRLIPIGMGTLLFGAMFAFFHYSQDPARGTSPLIVVAVAGAASWLAIALLVDAMVRAYTFPRAAACLKHTGMLLQSLDNSWSPPAGQMSPLRRFAMAQLVPSGSLQSRLKLLETRVYQRRQVQGIITVATYILTGISGLLLIHIFTSQRWYLTPYSLMCGYLFMVIREAQFTSIRSAILEALDSPDLVPVE